MVGRFAGAIGTRGRNVDRRICMKVPVLGAVLACVLACGSAWAEDATCAAKAIGKDGKPLAGAAKTSSIKKCCEDSAVGKDGKPLAGAALASFMKKCTGE